MPSDPPSTVSTGADLASLRDLYLPHINSFNALCEPGGLLDAAVAGIAPVYMDEKNGQPKLKIWVESAAISKPVKADDSINTRLMPNECRELGLTYSAPLMVTVCRQVGATGNIERITKRMGLVPVMVRSNRCHLADATPAQLVAEHEEAMEMGGTFIVNGNDRIVRLLIVPRRHYVTAIIRTSFTNRGSEYSPYACQLRCVRPDQSSKTLTLHYLTTGSATMRFSLRKQEFFLPVLLVLRALTNCTDREIYDRLVAGDSGNSWLTDRVELMLRAHQSQKFMTSRRTILSYLGSHFRMLLRCEPSVSDEDAGKLLLADHILVHCVGSSEEANNKAKFDCLIHALNKLYSLAQGHIKQDNPDALHCQEIMLPGHLYCMILKEKLEELLWGIKAAITTDLRLHPSKVSWASDRYFRAVLDSQKDIGRAMQYFVVTGNLVSTSGLDLMQTSGFTIVAERLNYLRYLAHFRAVHRGQFFTTMKTTDVRKLMPESFGFLCGVHTPDGAPCGLLNHLTHHATILTHAAVNSPQHQRQLIQSMTSIGLLPTSAYASLTGSFLPVIVDGIMVGRVATQAAPKFVRELRVMKVTSQGGVPQFTEVYAIYDSQDKLFPSIYVYTTPGRVVRPVTFLGPSRDANRIEWIGSQEQITLEIAITELDFRAGETTHQEIAPTSMFSLVASLTPFSDFNQSPRNMYQCQMGKQTMGTPFHSGIHRIDNKVFRIQNPQSPLVRNENYVKYGIDEYPLGTNAVVAVLAYTGYDMEDAMIINKMAYERGFKHGSVYKYKEIDLTEKRKRGENIHHYFSNILPPQSNKDAIQREQNTLKTGPNGEPLKDVTLDADGLPSVGQLIDPGQALYSIYDDTSRFVKVFPHKEGESCYIDDIRLLGDSSSEALQKVGIKLRFNRNPVIGDKFASRAGQKGVMSTLFNAENMPFTESGMTPDIIINPHAFPSRMTIGMLIESMAGKSGALHGKKQNSTPFQFSEQHRAVDYFGNELTRAGYSYVGSEPMYSGVTGEECRADIFIGLVYYQRLRHMVSDKAQVRATGPVNAITRQPIKGRKVHGGIRFGEMERDSLLGHGTAFLLHDRLMNCSDYHTGFVCTHCGSILSPCPVNASSAQSASSNPFQAELNQAIVCKQCATGAGCARIAIPYVFMYLANELAAMGIKLTLKVQ